ncbi:MAG: HDOD domain-containing protein [Fimbriimonadaceae bacterium]
MNRVLLVDDEPNVVQGLTRMMRCVRDEYETRYALSGTEALRIMSEWPADVVVSDMRMPGMNGVELLNRIAGEYPEAVRLILSGYTDREVIMQSAVVAHQFLSKPCDAQTLVHTLRRAASVRSLLQEPAIRNAVGRTMQLPCLSSTYDNLMAVLGTQGCTATDVADVVSKDFVLTAKVMQLVNSGFFGAARRVDSIIDAITCLGIDVIRALVATIEAFDGFNATFADNQMTGVFHHSLRVAELSRSIAAFEGLPIADQEDALLAGMLHDIGKLVLARAYPERYAETLLGDCELWPDQALERYTIGASQAEVGAYLLGLWGFQIHVVEAVAFHDRPEACRAPVFSLTTIVHAANVLAEAPGESPLGASLRLDYEYLRCVGKLDQVRSWAGLDREKRHAA